MEVIIILLFVVLIISFYNLSKRNDEALQNLSHKLDGLKEETRRLREELKSKPSEASPAKPVQEPEPKKEPREVIVPPKPKVFTPPPVAESVPPPREVTQAAASPAQPFVLPAPQQSWFKRWLKNNPDLEKFIGENLINKIGICILVLGIAFFVKYAIDQNWINEVGRVCIGLACGAGLTGLAHYMRNSYRSFSSVLAGGGIAVFYFTIAFAFHQYHLLNQTAAFILMVIITAFAVTLSILYDKIELAVIAAAGGFLTPFLVSSGQGNYIALFTYLIILNSGLLSLSYFKRWKLINILSIICTVLITGVWMIFTIDNPEQKISYPLALLLITVLYFIFLGMNMINQISRKQAFKAFDFSILLFITGSYFGAGIILLNHVHQGAYQGLFTLCSGLVDLSLAWYFFKRKGTDRNLLYLLIGLTLTFLSLAIPVQLHGHTITLFWSAEFVLLFWLYQRSRIQLFKLSSAIICALTMISLFMDWAAASANNQQGLKLIFTNIQGIATNIVVALSFALYNILVKKESSEEYAPGISVKRVRLIAAGASAALIYITCIFGVNLFFRNLTSYEVPNVYYRVITSLLIITFMFIWRKNKSINYEGFRLLLIAANIIIYLFSTSLITDFFYGVLPQKISTTHLWFHWFSDLLLIYLFYISVVIIRQNRSVFLRHYNGISWIISILAVIFLSLEFLRIYIATGYKGNNIHLLEQQYSKVILTILWAVCSFVLMWLGMRFKNKALRIVSLSLFFVALLKLVLWDIRNISEGGKIISFILLGVLLLSVSFMYQKLKKIIIDEKE